MNHLKIKILLEQNYTKVKPSKVVEKLSHLSAIEKNKLQETLDLYPKLFDRKLGQVPNYKFKIELKPGSTPSFQRQFPVLYRYQTMFENELQNMINNGVMSKRAEGSERVAPYRIRLVTGF